MTQTDATTVSNPEAASDAVSSAAVSGTGSELDSLLKEFESGTKDSNPALAKVVKAISPVVDYVNQEASDKAQAKFRDEVNQYVAQATDGLPEAFPRALAEGYLHKLVSDSPEYRDAFDNRRKSPSAWQTVLVKAKTDLSEMYGKLQPAKTETTEPVSDVKRAEAAVRNVSTEPLVLEPLDFTSAVHNMSERDWNDYKRKAYAVQQAAKKK